tara:strand:+ start:8871 stop:9101 length:231 start_codon:yes stop_codon:yes gene_type:complete
VPNNVFERPDMSDDELMKLINSIQNKLNAISKRGGYNEAHKQMQRQIAFLSHELRDRQTKKIDNELFDEKPFTIGE